MLYQTHSFIFFFLFVDFTKNDLIVQGHYLFIQIEQQPFKHSKSPGYLRKSIFLPILIKLAATTEMK